MHTARSGSGSLLCVILVLGSCGSSNEPALATQSDAVAAYVELGDDRGVARDLVDPLTMARAGEPSTPAGFLAGLRVLDMVKDPSGAFAARLIFRLDATAEDRGRIADRSAELGLDTPGL